MNSKSIFPSIFVFIQHHITILVLSGNEISQIINNMHLVTDKKENKLNIDFKAIAVKNIILLKEQIQNSFQI